MGAACLAFGLALAQGAPLTAQSTGLGGLSLPDIPVLTIEPDRLYAESRFGKRLNAEIEARGTQLAAENRRIEGELAEEESRLTGLRDSTPPEEFRKLAEAFDARVTAVRAEQDAKVRGLTILSEQAQRGFLQDIAPILEQVMITRSASVVLDRRAVFFSTNASDITSELITRIDETLGEGRSLSELQASDAQPPETGTPAPDQ